MPVEEHSSKKQSSSSTSERVLNVTQNVTSITQTLVKENLKSAQWKEFNIVVTGYDLIAKYANCLNTKPGKNTWLELGEAVVEVTADKLFDVARDFALQELAVPISVLDSTGAILDELCGDYFDNIRNQLANTNIKIKHSENSDINFYKQIIANQDHELFVIEYESALPVACISLHRFLKFLEDKIKKFHPVKVIHEHQNHPQNQSNPTINTELLSDNNSSVTSINLSTIDTEVENIKATEHEIQSGIEKIKNLNNESESLPISGKIIAVGLQLVNVAHDLQTLKYSDSTLKHQLNDLKNEILRRHNLESFSKDLDEISNKSLSIPELQYKIPPAIHAHCFKLLSDNRKAFEEHWQQFENIKNQIKQLEKFKKSSQYNEEALYQQELHILERLHNLKHEKIAPIAASLLNAAAMLMVSGQPVVAGCCAIAAGVAKLFSERDEHRIQRKLRRADQELKNNELCLQSYQILQKNAQDQLDSLRAVYQQKEYILLENKKNITPDDFCKNITALITEKEKLLDDYNAKIAAYKNKIEESKPTIEFYEGKVNKFQSRIDSATKIGKKPNSDDEKNLIKYQAELAKVRLPSEQESFMLGTYSELHRDLQKSIETLKSSQEDVKDNHPLYQTLYDSKDRIEKLILANLPGTSNEEKKKFLEFRRELSAIHQSYLQLYEESTYGTHATISAFGTTVKAAEQLFGFRGGQEIVAGIQVVQEAMQTFDVYTESVSRLHNMINNGMSESDAYEQIGSQQGLVEFFVPIIKLFGNVFTLINIGTTLRSYLFPKKEINPMVKIMGEMLQKQTEIICKTVTKNFAKLDKKIDKRFDRIEQQLQFIYEKIKEIDSIYSSEITHKKLDHTSEKNEEKTFTDYLIKINKLIKEIENFTGIIKSRDNFGNVSYEDLSKDQQLDIRKLKMSIFNCNDENVNGLLSNIKLSDASLSIIDTPWNFIGLLAKTSGYEGYFFPNYQILSVLIQAVTRLHSKMNETDKKQLTGQLVDQCNYLNNFLGYLRENDKKGSEKWLAECINEIQKQYVIIKKIIKKSLKFEFDSNEINLFEIKKHFYENVKSIKKIDFYELNDNQICHEIIDVIQSIYVQRKISDELGYGSYFSRKTSFQSGNGWVKKIDDNQYTYYNAFSSWISMPHGKSRELKIEITYNSETNDDLFEIQSIFKVWSKEKNNVFLAKIPYDFNKRPSQCSKTLYLIKKQLADNSYQKREIKSTIDLKSWHDYAANHDNQLILILPTDKETISLEFPRAFFDHLYKHTEAKLLYDAEKKGMGFVVPYYTFLKPDNDNRNYRLIINLCFYDKEKGIFGKSNMPLHYVDIPVAEFDPMTVEAFKHRDYESDQVHNNISIFLYLFMNGSDSFSENEPGMPGKETFKFFDSDLIFCVDYPFVGFYKLLEKFPNMYFKFDHELYDENTSEFLYKLASSDKKKSEFPNNFFVGAESQIFITENYLRLKIELDQIKFEQNTKMEKKLFVNSSFNKAIKESYVNYSLSVSLIKLIANLDYHTISTLLEKKFGIIHPHLLEDLCKIDQEACLSYIEKLCENDFDPTQVNDFLSYLYERPSSLINHLTNTLKNLKGGNLNRIDRWEPEEDLTKKIVMESLSSHKKQIFSESFFLNLIDTERSYDIYTANERKPTNPQASQYNMKELCKQTNRFFASEQNTTNSESLMIGRSPSSRPDLKEEAENDIETPSV